MRAALTDRSLAQGARALARVDPDLARVIGRHGPPPLWGREPGFATLVQIVLEQQVSLASGRAAFARPARVAATTERRIRAAGITRQKATYVRGLARSIVSGELDVESIGLLDDDAA